MNAVISPAELHAMMQERDVKTVDATYGIPGFPAAALAGLERARIGNAVFFNIDDIADADAPYAHTLPDAETFAAAASAMGIGNEDTVIVYDQTGISFAAARVWWMFRVFGHDDVRVLNGGLPAWLAEGLPTLSGPCPAPRKTSFTATYRPSLYRSFEDVERASETDGETIVDARAAPRFCATVHSADGDACPAHIPGSLNRPFQDLLDHQGRLKPPQELAPLLPRPDKPIVTSCGSGVTACVLALAYYEAGLPDVAVFDGSWTEWSDRNALR